MQASKQPRRPKRNAQLSDVVTTIEEALAMGRWR